MKISKHLTFIELVDDDLTDDIACTKIIFARHGFTGEPYRRYLILQVLFIAIIFQRGMHGRASVRDHLMHIKSMNASKIFSQCFNGCL